MPILTVLFVLIGIAILVWLINRAPFVEESWKPYINYLALALVVIWLLAAFGLFDAISSVRVGEAN